MVDYKNDYINLVVLGSFNPAILTHEFLVHECGFELPTEPDRKGPVMPVIASLDYGNLTFFADLGRLQITEKSCGNPKSSKLPSYLQTYLDKLPYTPVTKCGANFSYRLIVEKSRLEQIGELLRNNRSKLCEELELKTVDLEISFGVEKSKETVTNWTLRTKSGVDKVSTMLKVVMSNSGNEAKIDFNYDVANLEVDRQRLNSVTTNYGQVFDIFKNQVEKIFSG